VTRAGFESLKVSVIFRFLDPFVAIYRREDLNR
jgi:hypothetical protein